MRTLTFCECGTQLEDDHCKDCSFECYSCGNRYDNNERREGLDGKSRCNSCHEARHASCNDCDCVIPYDDFRCDSCDNEYSLCSCCEEEVHDNCVVMYNGEPFCCYDCLDETYEPCEECNDRHDGPCTKLYPLLPSKYSECYLPNRVFAVELETNIEVYCPNGWEMVNDGSIDGKEYLSGPILGSEGIEKIERGCPKLKNPYRTDGCNVGFKTGYHLHINAKDKNEEEISRFAKFCYEYQKDFLLMVPQSRRYDGAEYSTRGTYCKLLTDKYKEPLYSGSFSTTVYGDDVPEKKSKYNDERYYWVNFHSYFYRGTVEIRLHSGTTDAEKVLRWAELFLKLFEMITSTDTPFDRSITSIWDVMRLAGVRESTITFYKIRVSKFSISTTNEVK